MLMLRATGSPNQVLTHAARAAATHCGRARAKGSGQSNATGHAGMVTLQLYYKLTKFSHSVATSARAKGSGQLANRALHEFKVQILLCQLDSIQNFILCQH